MPTPRVLPPEQWPDLLELTNAAFLIDPTPDLDADTLAMYEPGRVLGIFEADRMLGGGLVLSKTLTLPGGGGAPVTAPVAGISYVGVRPDARGRGALRELMRAQLHGLHEQRREPLAVLTASMAALYGRYGYGAAARAATLTVAGGAVLRPDAPAGGTVRWVDAATAAPHLRRVHAVAATRRVGWLARPEKAWRWWLTDREPDRRGATAFRHLLHHPPGAPGAVPDGYAVLRVRHHEEPSRPAHRLDVLELVATTADAHAGLWRGLLGIDLVAAVHRRRAPLDDPLTLLLADPRAALTDVTDNLWVRLVDLDRALELRRYAVPGELTMEVGDRFCPWNAGRWRLRVDPDGRAEVRRTDTTADLSCDTTDLAAAYLGGTRVGALAAAGRVREHTPGSVGRLSRAMAEDLEPLCPEIF